MALTKSQIQAALADRTGLEKKDIKNVLDAQAALAYEEARNGFTIQGIGKLVLQNRAARMGRNPATGEPINIPAKTAVKFRVAKVAKDSIL